MNTALKKYITEEQENEIKAQNRGNDIWGTIGNMIGNTGIIRNVKGLFQPTPTKHVSTSTKEIAAAEEEERIKNEMNNQYTEPITGINAEAELNKFWEKAEAYRNEQWEREDQIRRETQIREDNAIQRKIEDMRAAGVNPNLAYSMSGAESGGGITQATGTDQSTINTAMNNLTNEELTKYQKEMEVLTMELEKMIDQKFTADQNGKDRANNLIGRIISLAAILAMKK